MLGFISPKRDVKLRMDSRIFSGSNCGDIASGRRGILLGLNSTRSTYKFCSQKKKAVANFAMAQPSLFFPYIDFTLMNVYMNTGIK